MINPTQIEIHSLLRDRWSPRAFTERPVALDTLHSLLEAARWSPSAANRQPWWFVVALRSDPEYDRLVEAMTGNNPRWANRVPVLILTVTKLVPERPDVDKYAFYDLGQSVAHLTVQATALGLHVHQMAGFDADKARQAFEIPDEYEPVSLIAVGYQGEPERLSEDLRERESASRTRKPLTEIAFRHHWNEPLQLSEVDKDES